jgi:hypothetical protein
LGITWVDKVSAKVYDHCGTGPTRQAGFQNDHHLIYDNDDEINTTKGGGKCYVRVMEKKKATTITK